jgi:hypothetical protein
MGRGSLEVWVSAFGAGKQRPYKANIDPFLQ